MPNLNVRGFELTESTSVRGKVALLECTHFEIQGDRDPNLRNGGRTLTDLTNNQIGLFLEVNKQHGGRGAAAPATLIAAQQV